jgi:hypothetical protein
MAIRHASQLAWLAVRHTNERVGLIAAIPWSSSPRSADTRGKTGAERIRQLRARGELSVS